MVTTGTGGTGRNTQFCILLYYYDPKILHIILSCLFLPVPNAPAQYPRALAAHRLPVPRLFLPVPIPDLPCQKQLEGRYDPRSYAPYP